MLSKLKCMFYEKFPEEQSSKRRELEHNRLRTTLNLSGNLMIGLMLFFLFYTSLYAVSDTFALGFFAAWTALLVAMLAAFEKMFKRLEESFD